MCLVNNQGNFQLHRFTRRENTAKSFRGATFLTHTVGSSSTTVTKAIEFGEKTQNKGFDIPPSL